MNWLSQHLDAIVIALFCVYLYRKVKHLQKAFAAQVELNSTFMIAIVDLEETVGKNQVDSVTRHKKFINATRSALKKINIQLGD